MHWLNLALCQLVVGLLFLRAGTSKMRLSDVVELQLVVRQILPTRTSTVVARIMGPIEIVLACLLLASSGRARTIVLLVASAFLLVMAWTIARLRQIRSPMPCRCFGPVATPVSWSDFVRNLALATWAAATAVLTPPTRYDFGLTLVLAVPSAAIVLLLTRLSEIRATLR